MRGTTTEQTPAIRRIPPRMTTRASRATAAPVVRAGTEKLSASAPAMELALGHVPHAQGGQDCEEGEEKGQGTSQPLPPQGGAHGIHGAAAHFAAGVPLAVLDGQQALRALGGKAEEGGDLHPHQRAGAARRQRRGNAHDVPGAQGGGPGPS